MRVAQTGSPGSISCRGSLVAAQKRRALNSMIMVCAVGMPAAAEHPAPINQASFEARSPKSLAKSESVNLLITGLASSLWTCPPDTTVASTPVRRAARGR